MLAVCGIFSSGITQYFSTKLIFLCQHSRVSLVIESHLLHMTQHLVRVEERIILYFSFSSHVSRRQPALRAESVSAVLTVSCHCATLAPPESEIAKSGKGLKNK